MHGMNFTPPPIPYPTLGQKPFTETQRKGAFCGYQDDWPPAGVDWYYSDVYTAIAHADCRDVLPTLVTFDLVHTDPPYGINANKQTLGKGKKKFYRGGDWDAEAPIDLIRVILGMGKEIIIWGGNFFTAVLPPSSDWLIWHKKNDGLTFGEFEMAWSNLGCQSRLLSHHWSGEEKRHPTAKPMPVIRWAISKSKTQGAVLDPFMGSGTTLRAAKNLGRKAHRNREGGKILCDRGGEVETGGIGF